MGGLLVKDFKLLLQRKKFFIMLIGISAVISYTQGGYFVMGYIAMVMAAFTISSISYDEYDNGYSFLFTLPVTRATYVREKYVYAVLLTIAGWLCGNLFTIVSFMVKGLTNELDSVFWFTSFFYIPIIVTILSLTLPVILRYGTEKGRTVLFTLGGVIVVVLFIGSNLSEMTGIDINFLAKMDNMSDAQAALFIACLCVVSFVIGIISCCISTSILEKKEY